MNSIPFLVENPFPSIPATAAGYRAAQIHAREVDEWLKIPVAEIETRLASSKLEPGRTRGSDVQPWIGLAPDALQTPYCELRAVLESLAPRAGEWVVDLGAAYGRLGLVMARHFPDSHFLGYELIQERVDAGRAALEKLGAARARLECLDLSQNPERIPRARAYFIYDFGSPQAIEIVLARLREVAKTQCIEVVGRGRAIRDRIERNEPWLSQVIAPIHGLHSSLYRSG